MAQVPRYDTQVSPSGQRQPEQQIRVNPEAFGVGIGEALQQSGEVGRGLAETIARRTIDIQERANVSTADDMAVEYNRQKNALLFDHEDSFYNLQGQQAFSRRKEFEDKVGEVREKIAGTSQNPHVRQLYDQQTRRDLMLTMNNISSHAASEFRKWEDASTKSYFDSLSLQMGMSRSEAELESNKNEIIDQSFAKADKLGLDPYSHELFVRNHVSKGYASYITTQAMSDPVKAQEFFAGVRDQMLPDDAAQLDAKLQGLVAPELGQRIGERIYNGASIGNVDNIISHIIKNYEGTDEVKDVDGYQVRMGINKRANPDVDLASLTEKRAIEIYKERYWAPIAGENIPPNMVLTALDSSIVVGPGRTKKWLQQANGDADKFNALRMQWFNHLAQTNPAKYAKSMKSWENRVADASARGKEVQPQLRREVMATLPEQMQAIRDMNLPDRIETEAMQYVRARTSEQAAAADAQYKEAQDSLVGFVANNKPRSKADALKDPTFFTAYNVLTEADKLRINNLIDSQGKVPMTAALFDQRSRWLGMAETDPAAFSQIKFSDYWGKIPEAMIREMQNRQVKIARGEKITHPAVANMMTYKPIQLDLIDAGLLDKNGKIKKKEKWNQFYGDAINVTDQWINANKRTPKPDEYRSILAPLFSRQRYYVIGTDTPFPGSKSHLEYKPANRPQNPIDIPAQEYSAAYNLLRQAGYKPEQITNVMVYDVWQNGQE